MKILIPFYLIIPGGIVRVIMRLIREILDLVDFIVLIVPKTHVPLIEENLPHSNKLKIIIALFLPSNLATGIMSHFQAKKRHS